MKKYYIIYAVIGIVFLICLMALLFNPDSIILPGRLSFAYIDKPLQTSTAGDIFLLIIGVAAILAVIATIIYRVYRFINKIKKKKDFTPDSQELYTKKQSSENISEWLISSHQGYLDKDKDKNNFQRKK